MTERNRDGSRGTGTTRVYTVEARLRFPENGPKQEAGMLLDGQWRPIRFAKAPIGVPHGLMFPSAAAAEHGYVSQASAMALAWWFLAQTEFLAVETRIVEFAYEYSYKFVHKADGEPIYREFGSLERRAVAEEVGTQG